MQLTRIVRTAGVLLVLGLARWVSAEPITYTFTSIANDILQPGFAQMIYPPALNALGTVAFTIEVSGPVGSGIFTGNGGLLTTIATSVPLFPSGRPSINDAGVVAFRDGLGRGALTGSGGPISTIVGTSASSGVEKIVGYPSINNAGKVTVLGIFNGGGSGILVGSGGPADVIAQDTTGRFSSFFGAPATINDAGTVAFLASLRAGGGGVFTGNGGAITTIADTSGPFSSFLGGTATINNAGMVVFPAILKTGDNGIFEGDGTQITTVADTTGPFIAFDPNPSINNLGMVAFDGSLRTGGEGIFTGSDPAADKVIAVGDPLFGSTVKDFLIGPEGLNDAGQVAFLAELGDGRIAIVRADPTAVPEPSRLWLGILGAAGLILINRRINQPHIVFYCLYDSIHPTGLGSIFRAKFVDGLRMAYQQGKLVFPGSIAELGNPQYLGSRLLTIPGLSRPRQSR